MDIVTYALARKYVDASLVGGGAVKGKNCTIQSIEDIAGGKRVTFRWILDDGTIQSGHMDVMDGVDGQDGQDGATGQQGPQGATGPAGNGINTMEIRSINGVSHLILTYTSDPSVEVDCGIIESNGEGKVFHDEDDWTPISFKINDMHPSNFVPNGKKRTIIVDKIAMSINQRRLSYLKVLTPISLNSTKATYNVYLESGHKYFVESDISYEGYLKEIVNGDNDYHDYSAKKPVIIDLTETFGVGYEPDVDTFVTMLSGDSGIRNKFYGETVVGWWSAYISSYKLSDATIKGRKQDGTLVDIEDFSSVEPYVYTNYMGYENLDGEDKSTVYDFVNKQTIYKTHSALNFSQNVLTKLTSSTVANEFAYVEDGTKHYLIKKTGYQIYNYGSTDWNEKYNPSLNPSKKLDMRAFFNPNLSFDGISVDDLLNAESSTSENNFNHFAGVSSAQFSDLNLDSNYFYPAWRYDDCNSIKDFFLKWGYDLDALDVQDETELVPYLHFTTTGIAFRDEDYVVGSLSGSTIIPALFVLKINEDIIDLHLFRRTNTEGSSYSPLCLQFIGRELKDGCKESSEDLINEQQDIFVTKKNPKASGSFTLGNGAMNVENGVSFFDATVSGVRSLAAGYNAKALGSNSFAFGDSTEADMGYSIAMGQGCKATKEGAISMGRKHMWTESGQVYSNDQLADGYGSVAIGTGCRATGDFALALIKDSEATNEYSIAIGYNAKASGKHAFAGGYYSTATGENAFAYGYRARANANNAVAIGGSASAINTGCVCLGSGSEASWAEGIAIGINAHSYHNYCIAIGRKSLAQGGSAIAIGHEASAPIDNGIAIGTHATSSRHGGIAIGHNSSIGSSQWYSIAIGGGAKVTEGGRGISLGSDAEAKGDNCIAIGTSTIARANQIVLGLLNIEDTDDKYAVIIGNGTMNNVPPHVRSNLLTVSKTGVIEATNLPAPPTTAGTYVLTATVTVVDDEPVTTYSWESTTT